jgi:branched-chain amino acid transport system ATP-binding protein
MSALDVENLMVNRAGLPVIRGASLKVDEGTVTVLLGANGAGKTTLLEGIAGAVVSSGGMVRLGGVMVENLSPYQRARHGLCLIEQGRAVFKDLTVEQNLDVARKDDVSTDEVFEIFPELVPRRHVRSGLLSGGEQQMLLIGRALLARPKVLLIDEMSLGLAPLIVQRLMRLTRDLAKGGLSILLVEQFAAMALAVGHRAYVLRRGKIAYDGHCGELRKDPQLLHKLYFGE